MSIGGFNCQPDSYDNKRVKLESSLNKIMDISKNNLNHTIIIGGNVNLGDINSDEHLVELHSQKQYVQKELLRIMDFFPFNKA